MILHIDFNSYFASVEQQANPRLRGKSVGVTGGDRTERTVIGAASIEAKKYGVKTGMQLWEAKKLCPQIVLVQGDSDKYLEVTKRFLSILKDYSPCLEVFSIDECFLSLDDDPIKTAKDIKKRIRDEIGEWIKCSIGISYNKLMAKLAGSLQKPDGLVVIPDQETAISILDQVSLDAICGIGGRIKKRLFNLGVTNFKQLRQVPLEALLASFKSYGQILYNMARGIDNSPIIPFYEKEEVKSIGHRHTIDHDTADTDEIYLILLKLCELVAARLRAKKLMGKTIHCWFRFSDFSGEGMQVTIPYASDGLEIFKAAWKSFIQIWKNPSTHSINTQGRTEWNRSTTSSGSLIRMIGVSISNLKPLLPQTLSLLPEVSKRQTILQVLDQINNKFGQFTLQRGILLRSTPMRRQPNPFLADRRFKL